MPKQNYGSSYDDRPGELNVTIRFGTKTLKAITDLIVALKGATDTAAAAAKVGAAADQVREHKKSLQQTIGKVTDPPPAAT